jgi:hypothetical protein
MESKSCSYARRFSDRDRDRAGGLTIGRSSLTRRVCAKC